VQGEFLLSAERPATDSAIPLHSCIFLELFARRPVFQGQDEIHQLEVIFKVTGTPNVEAWPNLIDLPWYELVKPQAAIESKLRETFSKCVPLSSLMLLRLSNLLPFSTDGSRQRHSTSPKLSSRSTPPVDPMPMPR
jgi:hypothetical protein